MHSRQSVFLHYPHTISPSLSTPHRILTNPAVLSLSLLHCSFAFLSQFSKSCQRSVIVIFTTVFMRIPAVTKCSSVVSGVSGKPADSIFRVEAVQESLRKLDVCLSVRASLHMRREEKPTSCHWMVYCTYNMLNMFRALLCPSSGARDYMCVLLPPMVRDVLVAGCCRSGA